MAIPDRISPVRAPNKRLETVQVTRSPDPSGAAFDGKQLTTRYETESDSPHLTGLTSGIDVSDTVAGNLTHNSWVICSFLPAYFLIILIVSTLLIGWGNRSALPVYAQETAIAPNRITTPQATATISPTAVASPTVMLSPTATASTTATATATAAPTTATPEPSSDQAVDIAHGFNRLRFYTVKDGDTLWRVAVEVGIDLDEVSCAIAPNFSWDQPLVIGDVLEIQPPGVRCHTVAQDETLADIAALYNILPEQIVDITWNRLETVDALLVAGHHLRILTSSLDLTKAGAEIAQLLGQPVNAAPLTGLAVGGSTTTRTEQTTVPANWPFGSGDFHWPTYGWLSQGYHGGHRAVDIAAPAGSPVTAADRGVVLRAGWNNQGYGNFVVIDHNIDYVTLYGHLSDVLVSEGQVVGAGDVIGIVGSTGNSTGPHLHFEIRDFGQLIDPLELLMP